MTMIRISRDAILRAAIESLAGPPPGGAAEYVRHYYRHELASELFKLWRQNPELIGDPDSEPRRTWDGQADDPRIADGMAAMWPE